MAKKPQRAAVEEIVKNLVNSEISGIQAVARDMADRVRQLEEHSIRIKQYTEEIEKLATESASDKYDRAKLEDVVKNLEKTITRLKKKQGEEEIAEPMRTRYGVAITEIVKKPQEIVSRQNQDIEEEPEERADMRTPSYTTPEGFVVRKIRQ